MMPASLSDEGLVFMRAEPYLMKADLTQATARFRAVGKRYTSAH
jgi:hypothetical protein